MIRNENCQFIKNAQDYGSKPVKRPINFSFLVFFSIPQASPVVLSLIQIYIMSVLCDKEESFLFRLSELTVFILVNLLVAVLQGLWKNMTPLGN